MKSKSSFDVATELAMPSLSAELQRVEYVLEKSARLAQSPKLQAPLARVLNSKGKRLRPALVLTVAAHYAGAVHNNTIHAAAALELAHIASLVHDDIIDHAESRRGTPTANSIEGVNQAILAGDVLFAEACAQGVRANAAVGEAVAQAIIALCDGESQEVISEGNLARSQNELLQAMAGKTAALLGTACRVGGLCANVSAAQAEALETYGRNFGMAFQLIDDVLDLVSTAEISGKPVGNDIREGVYTLPIVLALKGKQRQQVRTWLQKPDSLPYDELVALLVQGGELKQTIQLARTYNQATGIALQDAGGPPALASLPENYMRWALTSMTGPKYQAAVAAMLAGLYSSKF